MRDEKEYIDKVLWNDYPALSQCGIRSGIITFPKGQKADVIVGRNENGFEHVSIQMFCDRLPKWNEMCFVKDMFWNEEEEVVQIHPKKSEYINMTESLHLWRPIDGDFSRLNSG